MKTLNSKPASMKTWKTLKAEITYQRVYMYNLVNIVDKFRSDSDAVEKLRAAIVGQNYCNPKALAYTDGEIQHFELRVVGVATHDGV